MTGSRGSSDLAGRAYWDSIWGRTGHGGAGRLSFFHHAFRRVLDRYVRRGTTVCEVGCADSIWVPYLIGRGAEVTGLDYSEAGMRRLRESLLARGLSATLLGGDLLGEEPFGGRQFDVLYSLGLVEHFDSDSRVVGALVRAATSRRNSDHCRTQSRRNVGRPSTAARSSRVRPARGVPPCRSGSDSWRGRSRGRPARRVLRNLRTSDHAPTITGGRLSGAQSRPDGGTVGTSADRRVARLDGPWPTGGQPMVLIAHSRSLPARNG